MPPNGREGDQAVAQVVDLHSSHHRISELLPWYVTGRLDEAERADVAAHLEGCPECQADLALQHRLAEAVKTASMDAEAGWQDMLARIEAEDVSAGPQKIAPKRTAALWLGWAVAACLAVTMGVLLLPARPAPTYVAPTYVALGSRPADAAGDLLVLFKPDTPERTLRDILDASDLRLVDGPTAAGAYVLHTPLAKRPAVLAALRARPEVLSAAAIDADVGP